jgi:ubiquitin C-terminal hydrolase
MYTQDFIKRMLNQLVAALQMIIGLKTSGQYGQAHQAIDQALEQLLGLKADLVKRFDDQTILSYLTHNESLDADRLLILADLFKEEGDILAALGHATVSFSSHLRALNFYIEVALSSGPGQLPEPDNKLLDLFHQLGKFQLPTQTLSGLFAFFEKSGQYAQAARILSQLADNPSLQGEMQQEFQEYYQRLLEKTDTELELGGLSRPEIEKRLERFH